MITLLRGLPDPLMLLIIVLSGAAFWLLVFLILVVLDKLRGSLICRYIRLRKENEILKKEVAKGASKWTQN